MEVRQIVYVLEVAKQKNFSKAAQALYITQPTVSQQIRSLEDELGVSLFTRDTHNVILTTDGEKFCDYGQSVIDAIDELMQVFGQKNSEEKTILRIGVYTFYTVTGLAKGIARFITNNANVLCDVKILDNYGVYDCLKNGELTFGIIKSRPEHIRHEFEHIELTSGDYLNLLTCKDSEYGLRDSINVSEIGELNLTTGSKNSHLYNEMQAFHREHHQKMKISFSTIDDPDMMLDLISQGFTSALATKSVADAIQNDGIVAIPIEPPQEFRTYLVYVKGRKHNGSEKNFINYIKTMYNK